MTQQQQHVVDNVMHDSVARTLELITYWQQECDAGVYSQYWPSVREHCLEVSQANYYQCVSFFS